MESPASCGSGPGSRSVRWVDPKVVVPVILGALLGTHSGALALNDAQSSPTLADSAQPSTSGNGTRLARLQDALQTIAAYRLRFWQTGDQQSMLPQLHVARDQANDAYRAFLSQGDAAHSAQSLIALADIDRMLTAASPNIMQEQQQPVARMYENARQLAMQAKDPALEFKAINGLIRTDLNSRNYDAATRHLNALLAIAPTTRSPDDLLNAYDMASQIDIEMGDLAGANDQLDRAVAMSGQIRDPSNLYYVYSDRADVYYSRFQQCNQNAGSDICTKAAELGFEDSRRAIDIATRAGYGNLAAQAQSRLAEMKTLRGAQSALAETQQKLLALKFRITKPSQVAIAPHFTQPENPALAAALRAYENRVGLAGRVNVYDPTNYDTEGRIDELEGRNDAALQNYRKAVSYLEQDRRKLGGSRANGDPLGDRIEIYYDAAREFLERKEYPQAFQMLELSRSRAMSEMLESRKLSLRVPQDQELYSEAVALNSMLAGKQSELFDLARSEQSSARAKDLQMAIDELQARKRTLNDRIARQSPTLLDLVDHTQVASLASLQASARRGNYDVLYYLSLASGVIVWHIDAESVQVINVFYSGSLLADRTQALYDSASDANKSLDESAARELFLVLVNPLLQFAKTKHLVVIAHGPLNSLPFQLLKDPAGSYLGEGYAITYAPSATVLIGLGKPPNIAQGQLLAVANPRLGNAREEVKALGGLYPGRSKIVADTFATKQEVAGWIQDHNLIHLSVHGVFKSGEPLLSYLELRPHDADDGHLTAADMFGLHFQNNSLVVLSACETGRVEVTRSNEVLGMERGLLYAGASYLVMSSWRVDAAATELWMTTFYREAQTKPPNAAGRLALLAVKNDPKYQSPFFWAPFKMTGE
jgi:CHAT domain-containing protein